ncbi:perilipin-2-like isoform X2 [Gigantopelta aegis]|uniref:perilipin-2-like isoform X2 n=1 Tax=Gigantopelta aegis TaxID=1735272 RepID=UPI001B88B1EF|nr:perilipin-2-like isoform X2 [Gigantopelta aegis]
MYRQSLTAQNTKMVEDQFLTRLGSLPAVNSAWTNALTIYQRTKEWNGLVRMVLNLAETSVITVAGTAKPLVDRLQPQINRVNILACEQLAKLEEKYPAITHPTDQLVQEGKDAYVSMLKPVTDRVSAARDYSTSAYTGVVNTGLQKVGQVRKLGSDALSGVMVYGDTLFTKTFSTPYGQYLVQGFDGLLSISELYVDKYLPADPDEKDQDKPPAKNPIIRAGNLSVKLRHRLYNLSVKELQVVRTTAVDLLTRLNSTINVVDFVKTNFEFAKHQVTGTVMLVHDRLVETWNKIVSGEIDPESQNFEDQTILFARRMAHQLQCTVMAVTLFLTSQSNHLVKRLRNGKQYAVGFFHVFTKEKNYEEIPSWLLGQTRERIAYVQEALSLVTEYLLSTPLNWLVSMSKMSGKVNLEVSEKARQ